MSTGVAHRRAFTLIELIAVIVVLAILAGVAVPRYLDHTQRATSSAISGSIKATTRALVQYRLDRGVWPGVDAALNQPQGIDTFMAAHPFNKPPGAFTFGYEEHTGDPDPTTRLVRIHVRTPHRGGDAWQDPILLAVDRAIDDGDLNTGKFIVADFDQGGEVFSSFDLNP